MMKDRFCAFLMALSISTDAAAQVVFTPEEIYSKYSAAVVEVHANRGSGTGFVVSNDGLIVTANHVVAIPPSNAAYAPDISVTLNDGRVLKAKPIRANPDSNSMSFDFAVVKTEPLKGPVLEMGTWSEVAPGNNLTILGYAYFLPHGQLLLTGTVSGVFAIQNAGNVIVFQGPNNRGFSGGPVISNLSGRVVGIVDHKFVGITRDLDSARTQILDVTSGKNGVKVEERNFGVDPLKTTLDLINVLDNSLISGMGAAIAIDYAKAAIPMAAKH